MRYFGGTGGRTSQRDALERLRLGPMEIGRVERRTRVLNGWGLVYVDGGEDGGNKMLGHNRLLPRW